MSLVGALAHCAVNDAPVLIDTPFGRLDSVHRRNVVAWLPELADQVILFVTSGEFDEDIHRALLKDQIAEEYDLVPVSHIETTIRSR
jgi:DNA sulfur modification protein DndD